MATELRHLRYFAAVARGGSFVAAARALNVAQPALSRSIKELETDLGVTLFTRLPSGSPLTRAGEAFFQDVKRILGDLSAAKARAREGAKPAHVRLHIAHTLLFSGMHRVLDDILVRFSHDYPEYQFQISLLSTFDQGRALRRGEIDAGFGHWFGPATEGLTVLRLICDPYCAARVGIDTELAHKTSLSISDVKDTDILLFPRRRNPVLFDSVSGQLRTAGFTGDIVEHDDHSERQWRVLPRSDFWAFCPASEITRDISGSVCLPFSDLYVDFGLDAIVNTRTIEPSLDTFWEFLQTAAPFISSPAPGPMAFRQLS